MKALPQSPQCRRDAEQERAWEALEAREAARQAREQAEAAKPAPPEKAWDPERWT